MTEVLKLERILPGPIERVWDHLTQPDLRQTWLPEPVAVIRKQAPAMLEYAWNDDSSVRVELEARGSKVLLRLTHRRLRSALIGACVVLAAAWLTFAGGVSGSASRDQRMGPQQFSLKFHSSAPPRLYGMLGGRC